MASELMSDDMQLRILVYIEATKTPTIRTTPRTGSVHIEKFSLKQEQK